MEESILTSIKKLLGITKEYTHFDIDVIIHINTVLMIMSQLGMKTFKITGYDEKWSDYLESEDNLESAKTYIYAQVKLLFDTPQSSGAQQMLKEKSQELEWRIIAELEKGGVTY